MMLNAGLCAIVVALVVAPQGRMTRLDTSDAITYFIEDGKGVPGYQDSDRELARLAVDAWSRESAGQLKFTAAKTPDAAIIRFRWLSPNETGLSAGDVEVLQRLYAR